MAKWLWQVVLVGEVEAPGGATEGEVAAQVGRTVSVALTSGMKGVRVDVKPDSGLVVPVMLPKGEVG